MLLAFEARMAFTNYTKQWILYHHLQGRQTPTIVKLLREETILASRVRCFTKAIALRRLTETSRLFSVVPDVAITRNCITLSHKVFISLYKQFPPPLLQFLSSYNWLHPPHFFVPSKMMDENCWWNVKFNMAATVHVYLYVQVLYMYILYM